MKREIVEIGESVVAWDKYYLERLDSEIKFAKFLAQREKAERPELARIVATAERKIATEIKPGADLEKIVSTMEEILSPLSTIAKKYSVYCIGHAHIDMNWMWSWPETVAVTNDTFRTVLKLLDEFPQLRFSQSQASVYEIVEKHNPDMLEKIKSLVKEGRWEVTASHWVENEANIVGGEALCRHLLYTRRYMKSLFGLSPEDVPVNWAPDTFGHAATLPTYLAGGAVKYMYLHRPGGTGPKRPRAFHWKGPDGSSVLVKNDMEMAYNCALAPHVATKYLIDFCSETGLPFVSVVYGVGDHGGGPTRRDILRAIDMDSWPIFPRIKFSTAKEFFERLEREGRNLPVLDCELNFEFTGCYTSQSLIKKIARFGEKKLLDAERAALFASMGCAMRHDKLQMEQGWRKILFSHFHDILPGSGVHDTRTYCHGLYQEVVAITNIMETESLRKLASKVDTSLNVEEVPMGMPSAYSEFATGAGAGFGTGDGGMSQCDGGGMRGGYPFLVFNPTENEREEVIDLVVWDSPLWTWKGGGWENARKGILGETKFISIAPDGNMTPCQFLESGSYWGHDFVRIAFPVKTPVNGYAVYTVKEGNKGEITPLAFQTGHKHHNAYAYYERSTEGLENEFLRLEIDTQTGWIKYLKEKKSGIDIISNANVPLLEYSVERPHTMTSWEIQHGGKPESPRLISLKRIHDGPYKASTELVFKVGESEIKLAYELRAGDPKLHFAMDIVWFQRGTPDTGVPKLDLALPLSLGNPSISYEIPFGAAERNLPDGEEVPALRWAKVEGSTKGGNASCLLLNDSKHGHSFKDGVLRLSLIRASYDPDILPEIGRHQIKLAVMPCPGAISNSRATRTAVDFNHELKVVPTDVHNGRLPSKLSFIECKLGTAVFSGMKLSENSGGTVLLRFFNPESEPTKISVRFAEILGRLSKVSEADIMERRISDSGIKINGNSFSSMVPGYSIKTILAKLR